MEPITLAAAAGAYVAASIVKKSADEAIATAYKGVKDLLWSLVKKVAKPGRSDTADPADLKVEREVEAFTAEVMERSPALRRAKLVARVFVGARVLWVDDVPENNRNECDMLKALGAEVRQVRSTEALLSECGGSWDLILSDIDRDGDPDAGLRMLDCLPPTSPPVVYYVGRVDDTRPIPRGAFGIADLPESLLHLVLDVFERRRV